MNPSPKRQPIVQIRGLHFAYQGLAVLEDINLAVYPGDFLAILGPNGGGKTTLLKLILGLLTPSKGVVRVFNQEPGESSQRIGYVPQHLNFKPDFPIKVRDVVLLGLPKKSQEFPTQEAARAQAQKIMEETGIAHLAEQPFGRLSGGERQRTLIARALIANPELLIFDEPTSNIDPYGTSCFFDLLAEFSGNITIIIVSHDLGITAAKINRIACVNRRLTINDQGELTPQMLAFVYGMQAHECSAGEQLFHLTHYLTDHPPHERDH